MFKGRLSRKGSKGERTGDLSTVTKIEDRKKKRYLHLVRDRKIRVKSDCSMWEESMLGGGVEAAICEAEDRLV